MADAQSKTELPPLLLVDEEPNVAALLNELKRAGGLNAASGQRWRNDRIRYNRWKGRSSDFKKHRTALGADPIPWENAWDGRVWMADSVIEDLGDTLSTAFKRAKLKARPSNLVKDMAKAAAVEKLMAKYLERLGEELPDEVEFLWQFGLSYGPVVWHVFWDRQIRMKMQAVTMDQIAQAAQMAQQALAHGAGSETASRGVGEPANPDTPTRRLPDTASTAPPPQELSLAQITQGAAMPGNATPGNALQGLAFLAQLPSLVLNPAAEGQVAELIQTFGRELAAQMFAGQRRDYGDDFLENYAISDKAARKAARALREEGACEFPVPYLHRNGPAAVARQVGLDYFGPPEMTDLQAAPWHQVREWLGPADLEERKIADGWDPAWVALAIQTRGLATTWGEQTILEERDAFSLEDDTDVYEHTVLPGQSGLIEVIHAYVRGVTAEGVPQIWCTVYSPHVLHDEAGEPIWAKHYPTEDLPGEYPFIGWRWQKKRRNFHETPGVPEIVGSDQASVKRSLDMLVDRQDVEINPPWIVPTRLGMRYKAGPGAQVPVRRAGDLQTMPAPTGNPELAFQLIELAEYRVSNYFGLINKHVLPAKWQLKLGRLTEGFLGAAGQMLSRMWRLIQANASPEELARISGGEADFPRTPEEIEGEYALSLHFDTKDLDAEFVWKKIEAIIKWAVPLDRLGLIDMADLMRVILAAIDPAYTQLIKSQVSATQQMFNGVKADLQFMYNGNEPEYTENDPAAETKLQFAKQILFGAANGQGANTDYLEALGRLPQGDPGKKKPRFALLLENWEKNMMQSVKQEQNKQIGRLGVKPNL